MLTDLFLDKNGSNVPSVELAGVLSEICVPLAGRCTSKLMAGQRRFVSRDELMIEFELCIGLIFKPLRAHLKSLLVEGTGESVPMVWKAILVVVEALLNQEAPGASPEGKLAMPADLRATMDNLTSEHLRNAIMVLIAAGILLPDDHTPVDITTLTLESAGRIGINEDSLKEWKQIAISLNQ